MPTLRDVLAYLLPLGPMHRENLDTPFMGGIKHPIRGSEGYDESLVTHRAAQRERQGIDSADQQLAAEFKRSTEKGQRKDKAEGRLYELRQEREVLGETLRDDKASRLTDLMRQAGKERGEVNLIPLAKATRLTQKTAGNYRAVIVQRGAHKYVPYEYFLDQLAEEHGYADGDALKRGIERAARDNQKLADLDREIAHARIVASTSGSKRSIARAEEAESERRYAASMSSRPRKKRRRRANPVGLIHYLKSWLRI